MKEKRRGRGAETNRRGEGFYVVINYYVINSCGGCYLKMLYYAHVITNFTIFLDIL